MYSGSSKEYPGRHELQRLFSTFPNGLPAFGLLLLRATIGLTAIIQGESYLADWRTASIWIWIVGLLAIAGGILLVIGFLTPLVGTILFLGGIVIFLAPLFTARNLDGSAAAVPFIYIIIMCIVTILLGPGAFSLDARLFGRREIIIPED